MFPTQLHVQAPASLALSLKAVLVAFSSAIQGHHGSVLQPVRGCKGAVCSGASTRLRALQVRIAKVLIRPANDRLQAS